MIGVNAWEEIRDLPLPSIDHGGPSYLRSLGFPEQRAIYLALSLRLLSSVDQPVPDHEFGGLYAITCDQGKLPPLLRPIVRAGVAKIRDEAVEKMRHDKADAKDTDAVFHALRAFGDCLIDDPTGDGIGEIEWMVGVHQEIVAAADAVGVERSDIERWLLEAEIITRDDKGAEAAPATVVVEHQCSRMDWRGGV